MTINVQVIGAQHSCTRLFVGLLNQHPEIGHVGHQSVPSCTENGYHQMLHYFTPHYSVKIDKIIIVVRDKHCVNRSNKEKKGFKNVGDKAVKFITEQINKMGEEKLKDIIFTSYEMLYQYPEFTLKQLFRQIGVSEDYKIDNKKGFQGSWFKVDLNIKDVNEKYIKK